jgi:dinuclear metal center YbgI/SA1388 family protein
MVKCQVILDAMEHIAPCSLAEEWDNPGLLVGSPAQEIHKILVCLDISEPVLQHAVATGCDMILSHHPLIFHAIKKVRTDLPLGRMLQKLLANNIAVYAAHTNLDIASGGVNDVLAERIGLTELKPLEVTAEEELVKLVVYVPADYADRVRMAVMDAGAGYIGKYSCCTFNVAGKGTFLPLEGTAPFIGRQGQLENVDEVRIETILPAKLEKHVVKAMCRVHPYEEVAYDVYPLKNRGRIESLGRIGLLQKPVQPEEFAEQVRRGIGADYVRLVKAGNKCIQKVAICSGSGAEFIAKASFMGADAYVTGDVKYHDAQQAAGLGLHLVDGGHFATEFPVLESVAVRLTEALKGVRGNVEIITDRESKDFFTIVQ